MLARRADPAGRARPRQPRLGIYAFASASLLGAALGFPLSANLTGGAFVGTSSSAGAASASPAYSCGVDYASTISGTAGLGNYWRLGEGSGTTAVDQKGSANGTYIGAPTLGGAAAKPSAMGADTSAAFDGGTQYVDAGDVNDFTGTSPFAIEMWIKRTGDAVNTSAFPRIVAKLDNLGQGWTLGSRPASHSAPYSLTFTRWAGGTQTTLEWSPGTMKDRWYHVVGNFNGSTMALYVDGMRISSVASALSLADTTSPLRIGATYSGGFWPGAVDEVAIYNRALSPAEVKAHTADCTYSSVVSRTPGLQSYWRLDEASGTSVTDSGPNAATGTYVNAPALGAAGALPSGTRTAARFTAAANQLVNAGNNYAFSGTAPFTVETWLNPTTLSSTANRRMLSYRRASPANDGWYLAVVNSANGGYPVLGRYVNGTTTSVGAGGVVVATGTWLHVAGTYDGTNQRIYVNGVLKGTTADTSSIPAFSGVTAIGQDTPGSTSSAWDGLLDEVAIYNRALTGAEVASHYAAR